MQPSPTVREQLRLALGEDVSEWVGRQRNSPAALTYPQIGRVLEAETGIAVNREYIRRWAVEYAERSQAIA